MRGNGQKGQSVWFPCKVMPNQKELRLLRSRFLSRTPSVGLKYNSFQVMGRF